MVALVFAALVSAPARAGGIPDPELAVLADLIAIGTVEQVRSAHHPVTGQLSTEVDVRVDLALQDARDLQEDERDSITIWFAGGRDRNGVAAGYYWTEWEYLRSAETVVVYACGTEQTLMYQCDLGRSYFRKLTTPSERDIVVDLAGYVVEAGGGRTRIDEALLAAVNLGRINFEPQGAVSWDTFIETLTASIREGSRRQSRSSDTTDADASEEPSSRVSTDVQQNNAASESPPRF